MMSAATNSKQLPADLSAPAFVAGWGKRGLLVAAGAAAVAAGLAVADGSLDHVLRAWVLGLMLTFSFAVGALALLMVQYVTGGKWGLLLRRPLEAMSRTLPLVFGFWVVAALGMKRLYLWAQVTDVAAALKSGLITEVQAHAIQFKRGMLNPAAFVATSVVCFAIWGLYTWRLNALSLRRDTDGRERDLYWTRKFENLAGPGLLVYAVSMTAAGVYWVMSMDPTWYSSVYGLLFLVGQGYAVLALAIMVVIGLAEGEPYRSILRKTEQHDLGKLAFAFVMLNVYLAFSQYLIIWSGNSPDEIPWYLDRTLGHWGVVVALDCIFHWLIPFTLLLSRDLKRNRKRLVRVCQWMLFARAFDLFWLIEPNYRDAARNLHFSYGILEYAVVPVAMVGVWVFYFCVELARRPLVPGNDPLVAEILEAEDAHA
jgi:hypothetical protein